MTTLVLTHPDVLTEDDKVLAKKVRSRCSEVDALSGPEVCERSPQGRRRIPLLSDRADRSVKRLRGQGRRQLAVDTHFAVEHVSHVGCHRVVDRPQGPDDVWESGQLEGAREVDRLLRKAVHPGSCLAAGQVSELSAAGPGPRDIPHRQRIGEVVAKKKGAFLGTTEIEVSVAREVDDVGPGDAGQHVAAGGPRLDVPTFDEQAGVRNGPAQGGDLFSCVRQIRARAQTRGAWHGDGQSGANRGVFITSET